jgi:hypothetical protein
MLARVWAAAAGFGWLQRRWSDTLTEFSAPTGSEKQYSAGQDDRYTAKSRTP